MKRALKIMINGVLLGVLLICGCAEPKIPEAVSAREYKLYSAWINYRFVNRAPKALFLYSQTGVFDLSGFACGEKLHRQDNVPESMIAQFKALGTAQFPLDFQDARNNFETMFRYTAISTPPVVPDRGYDALVFSRVAFNRAGNEALFLVEDFCATTQCARGQAIVGRKTAAGAWFFPPSHCEWGN